MSTAGSNPGPAHAPRGPYFLPPIACRHVAQSRRMIAAAAASVPPGQALVLGAGACTEIPLAELAARFERVVLCDIDAAAMQQGVADAKLDDEQRAKIELHTFDLTGLTEPLLAEIGSLLPRCEEPAALIKGMAAILDAATPMPLPIEGRYELIVASCMLSQLHFGLTHGAASLFVQRFHEQTSALQQSPRWSTALEGVARRMEAALLSEMFRLLHDQGQIYLSESVQMCFVKTHESGQWQTEGTYRMLRTTDLADYVDARFVIVARERWEWIVWPPMAAGDTGRLFDVQAVVLRAGPR